jgi:hypothetical protein
MKRDGLTMDQYERSGRRRLGGVARALGDAVATPRGAAPDRALGGAAALGRRF